MLRPIALVDRRVVKEFYTGKLFVSNTLSVVDFGKLFSVKTSVDQVMPQVFQADFHEEVTKESLESMDLETVLHDTLSCNIASTAPITHCPLCGVELLLLRSEVVEYICPNIACNSGTSNTNTIARLLPGVTGNIETLFDNLPVLHNMSLQDVFAYINNLLISPGDVAICNYRILKELITEMSCISLEGFIKGCSVVDLGISHELIHDVYNNSLTYLYFSFINKLPYPAKTSDPNEMAVLSILVTANMGLIESVINYRMIYR